MARQSPLVCSLTLIIALAGSQLRADVITITAQASATNNNLAPPGNMLSPPPNSANTGSVSAEAAISPANSSSTGIANSNVSGVFQAGLYLSASSFSIANAPNVGPLGGGTVLQASSQATWGGTFTNTTNQPVTYTLNFQIQNLVLLVSTSTVPVIPCVLCTAADPLDGADSYYFEAEATAQIQVNGITQ